MTRERATFLEPGAPAHFQREGYLEVPAAAYRRGCSVDEIAAAQATYGALAVDPRPGNRRRAYARYDYRPTTGRFERAEGGAYWQSRENNYADGGAARRFEPMAPEVLDSRLVRSLLRVDQEIASRLGGLTFDETLWMGLHQIRYHSTGKSACFSSPPWLHKDDEPVVFIHLLHRSANGVGGDNVIARDRACADRVIALTEPLETLVVGHGSFHAMTPFASNSSEDAFRDILLVTFKNDRA